MSLDMSRGVYHVRCRAFRERYHDVVALEARRYGLEVIELHGSRPTVPTWVPGDSLQEGRLPKQPTAAALSFAKFLAILAARVRQEQLARVEPVRRRRRRQKIGQRAGELRVLGAARVPKSEALGHVGKTQDLFDPAVTIRRDDQDGTGKSALRVRNADDRVVVELALLPVIDELASTKALSNTLQERAENERRRELGDCRVLRCFHESA